MNAQLIGAERAIKNSTPFYSLIFLIYLLSFVFEGALRYGLSELNATNFLYIRDLIPIFFVLTAIFTWAHKQTQPTTLLVVLLLLAIHFWIGYFYLETLFQQLFGFKVFLPLLLGLSVGSMLNLDNSKLVKISFFVFVSAVLGVSISYFTKLPWEGAEYETAFGVLEQSRDWTASGVRRLAGFSRSSFDVASVLLISMVFCMVFIKSRVLCFLIWVVAMGTIAATTSKGALIAALIFGAVYSYSTFFGKAAVWKFSVSILILFMCLFPLFSLVIDASVDNLNTVFRFLFSSFVVRMSYMWPEAFSNLIEHGNILVGRGLGGIGVAQNYGEWRLVNAGDNLFVYLTVTFGLIGWLYLAWFYVRLMQGAEQVANQTYVLTLGLAVVVLAYGMTLNVIEQPVLAIILGIVIARVASISVSKETPADKTVLV